MQEGSPENEKVMMLKITEDAKNGNMSARFHKRPLYNGKMQCGISKNAAYYYLEEWKEYFHFSCDVVFGNSTLTCSKCALKDAFAAWSSLTMSC